ncbi:MAG: HEAT repeat domain-containing protein, partial [FCB group bacterium]|nr:HEAT repeat domain-containing protein [FCB group bacterium]
MRKALPPCIVTLALAALGALLVPVRSIGADTVTMTNGVTIDGQVQETPGGGMVVIVDGRSIALRREEVAGIEENDKTGRLDDQALQARWAKRNAKHLEETGLTLQQRAEIMKIMRTLQSSDPEISTRARDALIAKGREMDLFLYFEHYLPSLSPRFVPGVLDVLASLDFGKTRPLLLECCSHVDGGVRARAIALLGTNRDFEAVDQIARGLADPVPAVRIAAADALGALGAKEATPALIENLKSGDLRTRYVSRRALVQLWSVPGEPVDVETHDDWALVWGRQAGTFANPIELSELLPL